MLGVPRYTSSEIADKAGMELADARRIWRAMGFAEPPDDGPFFTDADLEALSTAKRFLEAGHADLELIITMARVISRSLSLAASAQADAIRERLLDPAEPVAEDEVPALLQDLETFLLHIWRRHLTAALETEATLEGSETETEGSTTGFADLVGFTRLSRHISEEELTHLVESFDSEMQEIVSELGGRIVKTIGDEVMFVMYDPAAAAEAALRMTETFPDDGEPPTVRVGLATGPAVKYRGDYFGPTVNLAARAVGEARPGTVLVSDETRDAVDDEGGYAFKPLRPRRLKGVGTTRLWSLRRAETKER